MLELLAAATALWTSINSFYRTAGPGIICSVSTPDIYAANSGGWFLFSSLTKPKYYPISSFYRSKKFPCSCCVYIWASYADILSIFWPSYPLWWWSGLLQSRVWSLSYLEIFLIPDKITYVYIICFRWIWVWCTHESLVQYCSLCLGHHDPPHMTRKPLCSVFFEIHMSSCHYFPWRLILRDTFPIQKFIKKLQ